MKTDRSGETLVGSIKPPAEVVLRLRLFYSSYAPLFAILALRFEDLRLAGVCLALGIGGFATTWSLLRAASRLVPATLTVHRVQDSGSAVAGYVASYLLPFVTVSAPSGRDLAAYAAFLAVAALVHIRSDTVDVNPTLVIFGYRLFRVTTASGWTAHMLARHDVPLESPVRASRIRDRLLVLREDGESDDGSGGSNSTGCGS